MTVPPITAFHRRVFTAAVLVHLCAAWFSTGFLGADEHYQVIAFAEARLGHQLISGLPWEYAALIRSAVLPSACLMIFKMAAVVGVTSPFILAFLLRLITAIAAIWAVHTFVKAVRYKVPENLWRPFLLLSFFMWFVPFLHVRFTGETWSGLFVLLALATLLSEEERAWRYLRCGLWLGLAFLCRPPTLAIAVGLVLWLAVVEREKFNGLLQLLAGIFMIALAGIALDSWFYGQLTFTAWNYLHIGIGGNADHPFIAFPWWYYPAWVVKYGIPPIGLLILGAFATLVVFKPKDVLVWAIVPFLLLHLALAHKELRFLYPLADLVPLLLLLALGVWRERDFLRSVPTWALRSLVALVVASNFLALAVVASSPAGSGRTRLAQQVQKRYHGDPVRINYVADETTVWDIRIPQFYLPSGSTDSLITDPCAPALHDPNRIELLVADRKPPSSKGSPECGWEQVEDALPWWKQRALRFYDQEDARPVWSLYEQDR